MPRSNRPRRKKPAEEQPLDIERLRSGFRRVERKRDGEYTVQPVSATAAVKPYLCPGCRLGIEPGVAHVVAWRTDGIMGEAAGLADRRHWHTHCWRIA